MKFVELVIRPVSPFGTPLKGDTIFGHFCWQLVYDPDLIKGKLHQVFNDYKRAPFVVFSSAFPKVGEKKWLLNRPALPLHIFNYNGEEKDCFQSLRRLKENKKRQWLLLEDCLVVRSDAKLLNEEKAFELAWERMNQEEKMTVLQNRRLLLSFSQPHNSINRFTFTTGEGFAPYQTENFCYLPGLKLSVFALFNEEILDEDTIEKAFARIGVAGFGRDASSGLGRFVVEDIHLHQLPEKAKTIYTMGPYVPAEGDYNRIWYRPFVRFGRHGGYLVHSGNPFKEPVLMADEGAMIEADKPVGPYLGRAVCNVSKALPKTLVQGYTIVLPFLWRDEG